MKKITPNYTDGKTDEQLIGHIGFGEKVTVSQSAHKKVLITGAGSYIGESFKAYAGKYYSENFEIDELDMIGASWRKRDFSEYDMVYHVAGIAHVDVGNVNEATKAKYYAVNTNLAVKVCEKAKKEGVKNFIFMSSMIVYGSAVSYGKSKIINEQTVPFAANFYGDSKLQADVAVRSLADDSFKVIVLRPPMIYGKGSKGNYPILAKLAKRLPIFPNVYNERSILYIDNLCDFLCQIMLVEKIKQNAIVLAPQNAEWAQTSQIVKEISMASRKNIKMVGGGMKQIVKFSSKMPGKVGRLVNKAFGNSCYAQKISIYDGIAYQNISLKESIRRTEGNTIAMETNKKPQTLLLASVASMIDLFNADNINILIESGFSVDVATNFKEGSITSKERVGEYRKELIDRGIGTYQVPIPRNISKVIDIIKSYSLVQKLVAEKQYQIVHCHSPIGGVICRLACIGARKKGTKVIYTAHGFHFYKGAPLLNWFLYYPVERFLSRWTDVLITINKEDYARAKKFKAGKVCYVPGVGVDVEKFRTCRAGKARQELRKKRNIPEDATVFISVGELNDNKNHKTAIDAFAKAQLKNSYYLICGTGPLKESLEGHICKRGVSGKVLLLGFCDNVPELLQMSDVFVFPSKREGLPVALMEAMACGLSVICSRIRGNADLIVENQGGIFCSPARIDEFKKAMKLLRNNKEKCETMGKFNRKRMKNFNNLIINGKMKAIYKSI